LSLVINLSSSSNSNSSSSSSSNIKWLFGDSIISLLNSNATLTGEARKDAKPGSSGFKRQLEEGNNGSAGLEQQGRGNKRCRLGPTEQLRVVVRQILAGSLTADMLCNANCMLQRF